MRALGLGCLAGTLASLLVGCASAPTGQAPPMAYGQKSRPVGAVVTPSPGLLPLPSPNQVITAVPLGRVDPFANVLPQPRPAAPASAGAAGGPGRGVAGRPGARPNPPQPLRLPGGFRFSGVIHTGGRSEAVVQYGEIGGSLRPGDQGGISTDLLPRGWSVAAINVQRGELTLQSGRQRITAQL